MNEHLSVEILGRVLTERRRQCELWGDPNYPNGTAKELWPLLECVRDLVKAKEDLQQQTWVEVAAEEFLEVITETDERKLKVELTQLAAVCVGWIESIEGRGRRPKIRP
jgi:hypothetical protein